MAILKAAIPTRQGEIMEEEWRSIRGFPKYSVSNLGEIRRDQSGRILNQNANQYGAVFVGLMRGHKQYHRSVPLIVAKAFIPRPLAFDTPINLDGDRFNNHVDNLLWRPRWFAVQYNRQFHVPYDNSIPAPIRDIDTRQEYPNSFEVARAFGLLERDVVLSILNHTYTWPTYQFFEVVL